MRKPILIIASLILVTVLVSTYFLDFKLTDENGNFNIMSGIENLLTYTETTVNFLDDMFDGITDFISGIFESIDSVLTTLSEWFGFTWDTSTDSGLTG